MASLLSPFSCPLFFPSPLLPSPLFLLSLLPASPGPEPAPSPFRLTHAGTLPLRLRDQQYMGFSMVLASEWDCDCDCGVEGVDGEGMRSLSLPGGSDSSIFFAEVRRLGGLLNLGGYRVFGAAVTAGPTTFFWPQNIKQPPHLRTILLL